MGYSPHSLRSMDFLLRVFPNEHKLPTIMLIPINSTAGHHPTESDEHYRSTLRLQPQHEEGNFVRTTRPWRRKFPTTVGATRHESGYFVHPTMAKKLPRRQALSHSLGVVPSSSGRLIPIIAVPHATGLSARIQMDSLHASVSRRNQRIHRDRRLRTALLTKAPRFRPDGCSPSSRNVY